MLAFAVEPVIAARFVSMMMPEMTAPCATRTSRPSPIGAPSVPVKPALMRFICPVAAGGAADEEEVGIGGGAGQELRDRVGGDDGVAAGVEQGGAAGDGAHLAAVADADQIRVGPGDVVLMQRLPLLVDQKASSNVGVTGAIVVPAVPAIEERRGRGVRREIEVERADAAPPPPLALFDPEISLSFVTSRIGADSRLPTEAHASAALHRCHGRVG